MVPELPVTVPGMIVLYVLPDIMGGVRIAHPGSVRSALVVSTIVAEGGTETTPANQTCNLQVFLDGINDVKYPGQGQLNSDYIWMTGVIADNSTKLPGTYSWMTKDLIPPA